MTQLTGYPSIDKPWLKYYSEEAISAPMPECTIYEYLWRQNKDYLNRIALNYFDNRIAFRELFRNIDRTAAAFAVLGVKAGDIVVIASVTTPETIYAFYALNRLGAVSNMVDPRTSAEGIREYIREVNATVVMVLDAAYGKIKEAICGTAVKKIVVVSPADSLRGIKRLGYRLAKPAPKLDENCVSWRDFIEAGRGKTYDGEPYRKDRCCLIVHTGGTTGSPKGVMLSDDNLNALVQQSILTGIDMQRIHTWMDIMPPFIAYGLGMGVCLPLVIGMETILIPSFDPKKFDELIIRHKPVHMVFVPSYWGTIIRSKKMDRIDLSNIVLAAVGGDSLDIELEKAANAFLKMHGSKHAVTKGYGMSEVCAAATATIDANNEIGSVGIPYVHTTISIFDPETGEELTYNQRGEVCITGPNVMLGYYGNPEATNAILRRHADGRLWIHSGDIGYMNEKGSLFIVDRMKRMIVRHDGFKVFPSQIEKTVARHNSVESCCTVGARDTAHSQGKLPVVFAVLKPHADAQQTEAELQRLCLLELPEYAQPVQYRFIDVLPLTPIGKIDYRALEEMAK